MTLTRHAKIGLSALVVFQALFTLVVFFIQRPNPAPVTQNDLCNPCTVGKHWDAAREACVYNSSASTTVTHDPTDTFTNRHFTVTRTYLSNVLGNLNEVATQARIVPSFKNGVANGFKVFSIQPDSIYQQIGIQNGDVITHVNGQSINSPDKALEIYQRLQSARRIDVSFDRRGTSLTYTYEVT